MKKAEITFEQLEEADACENKYAFRELFGEKARITPELAKKHAEAFDWDWAADKLLPRPLYLQWQKVRRSYRTRHRAEVEIADYNLKHTPSGRRRTKITEKQDAVYRAHVEGLNRGVREQEAELFARLYINQSRIKTPKTERLLTELQSKMEKLMREIFESNAKDQFMEDQYDLTEKIENIADRVSRRTSRIRMEIQDEARSERMRTRRGRQVQALRDIANAEW